MTTSWLAETYEIIYNWIKPEYLTDVESLCECNDGLTFRSVIIIINSLRLVHSQNKQQIIDDLYAKLDNNTLTMRTGDTAGYTSSTDGESRMCHDVVEKP